MRSKSKKAPRKSVLHDYMRDAYTEFAELLCEELHKKYPKSKAATQVQETAQKLIDAHFGKDTGGAIDLDQ